MNHLDLMNMSKQDKFEEIGGRKSLERINKIFYDKVYQHPWLKRYFESIPQKHIEEQQIDFMQKILGGENVYAGKAPPAAHKHMFITDELFEVRKALLIEAFKEANAHPELAQKWLALDEALKSSIVKKSISECEPRFKTDPILNFEKV